MTRTIADLDLTKLPEWIAHWESNLAASTPKGVSVRFDCWSSRAWAAYTDWIDDPTPSAMAAWRKEAHAVLDFLKSLRPKDDAHGNG